MKAKDKMHILGGETSGYVTSFTTVPEVRVRYEGLRGDLLKIEKHILVSGPPSLGLSCLQLSLSSLCFVQS